MPSDLPDFDTEGSCASCGRRAAGSSQNSGGPFHCRHCWGDLEGGGTPAITRHSWWTEAQATREWLERTRAALPAQRLAMGFSSNDAEDEHFFTITDQAAMCFGRGVGAKKVWPATLRLCRYLHDAALEARRRLLRWRSRAVPAGSGCRAIALRRHRPLGADAARCARHSPGAPAVGLPAVLLR